MTRGTLFYYESDDKVWSSTEFNGDMYHNEEGYKSNGDEVIELMQNLESVDDFIDVLIKINHHYKYDEGDGCYSVSEAALEKDRQCVIEWIDKERPDLKGNEYHDPRAWGKVPTFKDVRTWQFWGVPNLSDYTYIYNNSGKDLVIKTKSKPIKMTIPHGCLGVLNFGSKDCLCKDGKIIDGMGNYKETSEEPEPMNKEQFYNYLIENFTLDGTSRSLIHNILDYVEKTNNGENTYTLLSWLLDGIGFEDGELRNVKF